jgi:hypothetical protein
MVADRSARSAMALAIADSWESWRLAMEKV